MGCDIHVFVERFWRGKWVMDNKAARYAPDRNYGRFAALAGVRGPGPKPKGLPDDCSDSVLMIAEDWGHDGHSHSWYTMDEAIDIWVDTDYVDNYMGIDPSYYYFNIDKPGQYRVVFWFDN